MKKLVFITLITIWCTQAFTQTDPIVKADSLAKKDTLWNIGGGAVINLNQTSLTNWAAGGESNLSATVITNLFANYKKEKSTWDNTLNMNYGLITANNYADIRKNDDRIELNSKYGQYAFANDFYYSALINFITQFAAGYDYATDPEAITPISQLMSPGYLSAALGLDWKPSEKFSVFLSPATGKYTFVLNDAIASQEADTINHKNRYGVNTGENFRAEFGASLVGTINTKLGQNVVYSSKLVLFNNFTDPIVEHRGNIDVDFQNSFNMKVSKYFAATLLLQILYDHDIAIPTYDADNVQIGAGPKTQFKEVFGIGFSYTFK